MTKMDMLQVKGDQIVDRQGRAVSLRGVCLGGWMDMEDFINGYPGPESGIRSAMVQVLGRGKPNSFATLTQAHRTLTNQNKCFMFVACLAPCPPPTAASRTTPYFLFSILFSVSLELFLLCSAEQFAHPGSFTPLQIVLFNLEIAKHT